jgi:hypothetical protein
MINRYNCRRRVKPFARGRYAVGGRVGGVEDRTQLLAGVRADVRHGGYRSRALRVKVLLDLRQSGAPVRGPSIPADHSLYDASERPREKAATSLSCMDLLPQTLRLGVGHRSDGVQTKCRQDRLMRSAAPSL